MYSFLGIPTVYLVGSI